MLDRIDKPETINEKKASPGDRLEELFGDRDGRLSVRINDRYRICRYWIDNT